MYRPRDIEEPTYAAYCTYDEYTKYPISVRGDIPTHELARFVAWVEKVAEYVKERGNGDAG